jgi:TRAP transporter TAXI family solute receptor
MMPTNLPRWLRIAMMLGLVVLAGGAGLFTYRYFTRPVTLTVAAGSIDGEAAALLSIVASRLASDKAHIRLKVVDSGTTVAASKAFAAGAVDLAVVRADMGDLSAARTVSLLTHGVVMILVPPGSAIKSMEDLKGKTVGVVSEEANRRLIEVLTQEHDLARAKVHFIDLALPDIPRALQSKHISALLVVTPVADKYLSLIRNLFDKSAKRQPGLIEIESAGAIAAIAPAYESYDLPKGTLRGSPPLPDDDLTTLRVPIYLVANKKLDDDVVGDLAKNIMDVRRDLLGAHPLLAQIAAPSTDKDAFIPIHPGAAAYFDGDQKTFFDKYGDQIFYGSMLLGSLTSILAAGWKFMQSDAEDKSPLNVLYALANRIRHADDEAELGAVEEEIDNILKAELAKHANGESDASNASALALAAHRLEHLIDLRRSTLQKLPGGASGVTTPAPSI